MDRRMVLLLTAMLGPGPAGAQHPDLATIEADLVVPPLAEGEPGAGRRVKEVLPDRAGGAVYHVLYLPPDWREDGKYPVLVEFAGNGPYRNNYGDYSSGRVEGSRLGYGISGGRGFLWLCLPYLNAAGTANVTQWWGDPPAYDPQPTIDYCLAALARVCTRYGGDRENVILCGFSRGAIACNFLGLHDDEIAGWWKGFVPYSHYDGVNEGWPYPGADRASALRRLQRLGGRPQFICGEGDGPDRTAAYLEAAGVSGSFTIRKTGFRNHSDAWILRPSPAREELREWVGRLVEKGAGE